MIIKEIDISSFGKFKNYQYSFKNGLNEFIEDNGWGKTTLTQFIFFMLYGSNSNRNIKNIISKYFSFNEESCGGSLTIEVNNTLIKINRRFNHKMKIESNIYEINSNKNLYDYKEIDKVIGEQIFKLDSEGFIRTILVNQSFNDLGIKDSPSVVNLIHEEVGHITDLNVYHDSIKKIDEDIKKLKTKKGATKNIGKINQNLKNIDTLKKEVLEKDNIESKITNLEIEIKELLDEKDKLVNSLKPLEDSFNNIQLLNKFNSLISLKEEKIEKLNKLKKETNDKEIDSNDLDSLKKLKEDLASKETNIKNYKDNINILENENKNAFKGLIVDETDFDTIKNGSKIKIEENNVKINNSSKKKFITNIFILFFGIIFITLGSILFSNNDINKVIPITFISIGALITLLSLIYFIFIKVKKDNNPSSYKEDYSDSFKYVINKYLNENEINDNYDLARKLFLFKKEKFDKNILELEGFKEKINDLEKEINEDNLKINEVLSIYNIHEDNIYNSVDKLNKYKILMDEFNKGINEVDKEINEFKDKYKDIINLDNLNELDVISINNKKDEINNKIKNIEQDILLKENYIDEYKEELDKIETRLNNIEELKLENIELEKEFDLLNKTKEYFDKTYKLLLTKYVDPLKNEILPYLNNQNINNIDLKNINLDENFDIKLSVTNEVNLFDTSILSKGYFDYLNLVIRISLIKLIFKTELPFIILDDPFTNFDKEHINDIKDIINILSKDYQIIYLSCHESRSIK